MNYTTYYLNNSGSRWVNLNKNGDHDRIELTTKSGKIVSRSVNFWHMLGNYPLANISYHGKRINVFHDTVLND